MVRSTIAWLKNRGIASQQGRRPLDLNTVAPAIAPNFARNPEPMLTYLVLAVAFLLALLATHLRTLEQKKAEPHSGSLRAIGLLMLGVVVLLAAGLWGMFQEGENDTLSGQSGTNTPAESLAKPKREYNVSAVLFQQHAAEYQALCYQAFNLASERVTQAGSTSGKPLAVITDIDETTLDNSPYSGMQILEDEEFTKEDWKEWGMQQSAQPVPGAVDFFNLADSLGVEVFYISNRYQNQLDETVANLQQKGFPNADTDHVFLKTDTSEKQARRDRVLADYEVVLYLGDNLSDFSQVFDGQSTAVRGQFAASLKKEFGDQFIVLPNAMYGDWESKGIYEGSRDWTAAQKDSLRLAKIQSYK